MPRILIVGGGSIGQRHLRSLVALGERDILFWRTRPEPIPGYPEFKVFTDFRSALQQAPELVFICCPTSFHIHFALLAAKSGCHLFVEKPLSDSWKGIPELLRLLAQNRLMGTVGFDLRFDPGLCKVKDLLEQGVIGRVTAIQAQVGQYLPDWHPWEDYRRGVSALRSMGGGVILDLIHELDYVQWLLGPAKEISCVAAKVSSLEIETEDTAAILLRFCSGAVGTVHLDYIQRDASRTCRVVGEEGTMYWDAMAQTVEWYLAGTKTRQSITYSSFSRDDRFERQARHVLDSVRGLRKPAVSVQEGADVLRTALAAKKSARVGRVISVNSESRDLE